MAPICPSLRAVYYIKPQGCCQLIVNAEDSAVYMYVKGTKDSIGIFEIPSFNHLCDGHFEICFKNAIQLVGKFYAFVYSSLMIYGENL